MINWTKYSYKVDNKKTERRKKKYVKPSYNITDIYRFYKETFVNNHPTKKGDVDAETFKAIQYEYNKVLSQLMIEGHQVKIPYGLGELGIRRRKPNLSKGIKAQPFNYGHYNKTGEKIFFLNDGWNVRFYWRKGRTILVNKQYYSFVCCDTNKKALGKVMKTRGGYLKYFEAKTTR